MTIFTWKTNFIGINIPPKVIFANIVDGSVTPYEYWPYANTVRVPSDPNGLQYPTDPWYGYAFDADQGISTAVPYQWKISFTVPVPAQHGSNITRLPKQYDANDIEVGDFVAGAGDGKVLQVISILEKNAGSVTVIVEDTLRYNTFKDPSGNGLFSTPGNAVFFNINELGVPMLDPLPSDLFPGFTNNVISRFNWLNPLNNYILYQKNNEFQQGDAICIENEEFVLATAENVSRFIGTVLQPGPGPNQFILRPANGIIDFVPGLPGVPGDYLYPSIDGSGDLTLDDASRRPVFMKISMALPSFTIGQNPNPLGSSGDVYQINGYDIVTSGSNYSLAAAAGFINAKTNLHKVTADVVKYRTSVTSNTSQPRPYPGISSRYNSSNPMKATINGVEVIFSTHMYGTMAGDPTTLQLAGDWVYDINAANVPNVIASSADGSTLTLTNIIGEDITIVNVTPDLNGNNFAGPNSCSAVALSTPANGSQNTLRLRRLDGGPILITDAIGQYLTTTVGLSSGQNGRYALGLNIEQGLRSSNTSVVADITARDALIPLVGDEAYVINSDDGNGNYVNQWSTWLYNGSTWTLIARQSSSTVSAKTVTYNLTNTSPSTFNIGTIVSGARVTVVTVEVSTAFSSSALLELGYSVANPTTPQSNASGIMTSQLIDLSKTGVYVTTSDVLFGTDTETGDVTLTGSFTSGGSTTGSAQILISYV